MLESEAWIRSVYHTTLVVLTPSDHLEGVFLQLQPAYLRNKITVASVCLVETATFPLSDHLRNKHVLAVHKSILFHLEMFFKIHIKIIL